MKKVFRLAAKWIAILVLSIGFAEFSVRWWGVWPTYSLQGKGVGGGKDILRFSLDEDLLYRLAPDPLHHINPDGFRDSKPTTNGGRTAVVVGDSFPMGLAVSPDETFPKQLQALVPDRQVYNMGVQGYGPDQELISFERFGVPLAPDVIIVSLYPANDLGDLNKNGLLRVDPLTGSPVAIRPNIVERAIPPLRLQMALRLIATGHFLAPSSEEQLSQALFNDKDLVALGDEDARAGARDLLGSILRRFTELAAQMHARLFVLVIPAYSEIQGEGRAGGRLSVENEVLDEAAAQGVRVIDPYEAFVAWSGEPLFLDSDRHLSARGHLLVAQLLAQAVFPGLKMPPSAH